LSTLLFCIVLFVMLTATFEDTESGIKIAGLLLSYIAFTGVCTVTETNKY